jgi:hypothetical protein
VFALPPGMADGAAGILLLIIVLANVTLGTRTLSWGACLLRKLPAASAPFSDGWISFYSHCRHKAFESRAGEEYRSLFL